MTQPTDQAPPTSAATPKNMRKAASYLRHAVTDHPEKLWRHKYAEPYFMAGIFLQESNAGKALDLLASHAREDETAGLEWLAQAARLRLLIDAMMQESGPHGQPITGLGNIAWEWYKEASHAAD